MNSTHKIDLYTKAALTVIALLLAVVAFGPIIRPLPIEAQSVHVRSDLRFDPEITKIARPDGSGDVFGRVAIDLRSGDVYGFPADILGYPRNPIDGTPATSDPIYLGRFNLDARTGRPPGSMWRKPRPAPRPGGGVGTLSPR